MTAKPTSPLPLGPLGEVGAQRRVRGYGLSLEQRPSPDLLTQIDLSPLGKGELNPWRDRFNQKPLARGFGRQRLNAQRAAQARGGAQ
jgi:hypothetical protein